MLLEFEIHSLENRFYHFCVEAMLMVVMYYLLKFNSCAQHTAVYIIKSKSSLESKMLPSNENIKIK